MYLFSTSPNPAHAGPKEPNFDQIYNAMGPVVEELLALYTGCDVVLPKPHGRITLQAILGLISADLPAAACMCGFPGATAILGCSKCFAELRRRTMQLLIGDLRTRTTQKAASDEYAAATNDAARTKIVKSQGARASALNALPYLSVPRDHTVDAMHCLILGVAKDLLTQCKNAGYFDEADFHDMELQVLQVKVPAEFGARPVNHIEANLANFKSDQVSIELVTIYRCEWVADSHVAIVM
jgi:hypothetical protein